MPALLPPDGILSYGRMHEVPDDPNGAVAHLVAGQPLRLSDGPYPFAEPPDIARLAGTGERLACLKELLQSLGDVWDKPLRLFLDAYFAWIDLAIAEAAGELDALAARTGGLFAPRDWSFAALRPLPHAHLPLPDGPPPARVDVAFWAGAAPIAIALKGSASPMKQRLAELARVAASDVALVEIPLFDLQRDGARVLHRLLPQPFHAFWRGVDLPSSPFGPQTLDEIRRAGD